MGMDKTMVIWCHFTERQEQIPFGDFSGTASGSSTHTKATSMTKLQRVTWPGGPM